MTTLDIKKLAEYGQKTLEIQGEIVSVETEKLDDGNSPAELSCINLTFEACSRTLTHVQKETYPTEVQVMLALEELEDEPSLPELID